MQRRTFLNGSTMTMLAAMGGAQAFAAQSRRQTPWGLELFTVLPLLLEDFEGTIKKAAALGYKEVETIASFNKDPKYVRAILDKYGLKTPSQQLASHFLFDSFAQWSARKMTVEQLHINYVNGLRPETVEAVTKEAIGQAKVLGQKYIVWPILMAPHLATRQLIDQFTVAFNRAGAMCRDEGLAFAYHNHHLEFGKMDGQVIYDIITSQTDPKLVKLEMDLYWVNKGGADPIEYMRKLAGRIKLIHIKDMTTGGDFETVGKGILDIPRLVNAAKAQGAEHFYVEFDRSADPIKAITESIAYLKAMK